MSKSLSHTLMLVMTALFLVTGVASKSEAQFVVNPSIVQFTPSPDHDQVSRYEFGFFLVGAPDPVQIADLGKPAPVGGTATVNLPSRPVAIGVKYVGKARAFGADPVFVSPWSEPSNEFGYSPNSPSRPVVARSQSGS